MRCPKCKNESFKIIKKKHPIKTRFSLDNEIVVENLPVNECKICGHTVIPESSEKYITMIREKIRDKMKESIEEERIKEEESSQDQTLNFSKIKDTIKKIIG